MDDNAGMLLCSDLSGTSMFHHKAILIAFLRKVCRLNFIVLNV